MPQTQARMPQTQPRSDSPFRFSVETTPNPLAQGALALAEKALGLEELDRLYERFQGLDGAPWDAALEVLQLRLRREILKFLDQEIRTRGDIEKEFDLKTEQAEYHLAMLEKGLVIERVEGGYRSTATGRLYLEKVEGRR